MVKGNKPARQPARGRKLGNTTERLISVENKIDWLLNEAFQTLADSVAEQASACQAMLKVLAELHPDRRMVKCVTPEGAAFYEFKTLEEIEAQKAKGEAVAPMEANDAEVQPAKH